MKIVTAQLSRRVKTLLCLSLGFVAALQVRATDPIYQNVSDSEYVVPGNPPPTLDVKAFDNENTFAVNYQVYNPGINFFQTRNTLFYTNNSTMIANEVLTSSSSLYSWYSLGVGFQFDLWTTNAIQHRLADTFYNAGTIRCNSTNDGNNILFFNNVSFFANSGLGECLVNATNVIIPGNITVGPSGVISINSQNADLSEGTLNIEASQSSVSISGNTISFGQSLPGMTATGDFGNDNFAEWAPGVALNAGSAYSSYPDLLILTNSTSYFDFNNVTATNIIVRAVFVQNGISSIPYNVYFGQNQTGNGGATVEWVGGYQDPASGTFYTNYLYLNNDYVVGASTNVYLFNGVPSNFQFTESPSKLVFTTPTTAGFTSVFQPSTGFTNPYSFVNANFISSSVATNASGSNPSGAITNLYSKIYITASNELNLAGANISGANYLSLNAPYQFDGSAEANIQAPFSDINLGVTNGNLDVANLLAASVNTFNGNVQAWSTRWQYTDANGVNYDFRVMLVGSTLSPQGQSYVHNLRLHATNNLVIHDVLNVYNSMYIDAKSLTLETNGYGNGISSVAGQLNWLSTSTLNTVQLPFLQWFTNNGVISAGNDAIFGTAAAPYGAFINHGLVSDKGTTINAVNFLNDGVITNGSGSFSLKAQSVTITNGSIFAGGDMTINTPDLLLTNSTLIAGRSLTWSVTNSFTDYGAGNGYTNFISVGTAGTANGMVMTVKPASGDFLGTTFTNTAPGNKTIVNTWAGIDYGYTNSGFVNNMAIGRLVLDTLKGPSDPVYGKLKYVGAGTNNAIYVDCLILHDFASYTNRNGTNLQGLLFGTNLVIYYAQALQDDGTSVAEKINHWNTNHLRWVSSYAGNYSSTNLVYPAGVTNVVNAALAQSTLVDSDHDGIPNAYDSTPFLTSYLLNFTLTVTNNPARARLEWTTIPSATNYVWYSTNLADPNWLPLTNFANYYYGGVTSPNTAQTNWFVSPLATPNNPSIQDLRTNVWLFDSLGNTPHFYRVLVQP